MSADDASDGASDGAPNDQPDDSPDAPEGEHDGDTPETDAPDDAPPKCVQDEIQEALRGGAWREDEDVQIERAIAIRALNAGGLPGLADIIAMSVAVERLVRASVLLQDLADATTICGEPPRPAGLSYIANAMNRDAVRLFRLYHGRPPDNV